MSGPSIILDPIPMFNTLSSLDLATTHLETLLMRMSNVLQDLAEITFAHGFSDLLKKAQTNINHFGHAVVAATNEVNIAFSEVVNLLIGKFIMLDQRASYNATPYEDAHIKLNPADRAEINPAKMKEILDDMTDKIIELGEFVFRYQRYYDETAKFWVGKSADQTRKSFHTRVMPKFADLLDVLRRIHEDGIKWIDESVMWEATL